MSSVCSILGMKGLLKRTEKLIHKMVTSATMSKVIISSRFDERGRTEIASRIRPRRDNLNPNAYRFLGFRHIVRCRLKIPS